jgi:predicted transcriptional regulator of viral defense system
MVWLVEHGPIVIGPPLPTWALDRLVKGKRILRLRRDVFLAPAPAGRLPSIGAVASLLAPGGYISFYAAMILQGLTDQDASRWVLISDRRQADAHYGDRTIHFVFAPGRAAFAHTESKDFDGVRGRVATVAHAESKDFDGVRGRVATVAQAVVDSLVLPSHAPRLRELVAIIRLGLQSGRLNREELVELVLAEDSPAVARRAGFLLELVGEKADSRIRTIAVRSNDRTNLIPRQPTTASSRAWRLDLPAPESELLAAAREV